jgi:hypothetical protein
MGISYFGGDLKMLAAAIVISGVVTCAIMTIQMQHILPVVIDLYRCVAGSAILIVFVIVAIAIPIHNDNLYNNIKLLTYGVIVASCCMATLLWRNPALKRLLSVTLRNT